MEKSRILFSKNTSEKDRLLFCDALNIQETSEINPYSGFPLSGSKPSERKFHFILQKITGKLASWKFVFLSKVGRLCLISSTLNTIPNYYIQCMLIPESILNKLNKVIDDFLWGKGVDPLSGMGSDR